jgi:hypothetical protein
MTEKLFTKAEVDKLVAEARQNVVEQILDKKRDLYEIGSRESEAIQFVINCVRSSAKPAEACRKGGSE